MLGMGRWGALFAAIVVLSTASVVSAQDPTSRGFTANERARLAHGELVRRMVTKQRGSLRLVGGTSWQVIDASPDAVWRALRDVPRYPRMLPRVNEAHIVTRHGNQATVMIQHDYGIADPSYYLRTR